MILGGVDFGGWIEVGLNIFVFGTGREGCLAEEG